MNSILTAFLGLPPITITVLLVLAGLVAGWVLHYTSLVLRDESKFGARSYEFAGHFIGVVGVLYAVVVAFVVVTAWQQFDHAAEVAVLEENSVDDLFHLVLAYPTNARDPVLRDLFYYAYGTRLEWEQMKAGQPLCMDNSSFVPACEPTGAMLSASVHTNALAHCIISSVADLHPKDVGEAAVYEEAVRAATAFSENREHRRHHYGSSPLQLVLWLALIFGSLVLIEMPYLLVPRDELRLRRTCALSVLIALMFGLSLIFSHPFTGSVAIDDRRWSDLVFHFHDDICEGPTSTCPLGPLIEVRDGAEWKPCDTPTPAPRLVHAHPEVD